MEKPSAQHQRERADDRHRYREQWNDGRAPGLQEQDHDDHHQQDRLAERLDHGLDRIAHEAGRVIHDAVVDALGEPLLELRHGLAHVVRELERVRPGRLEDRDGDRRLVVEQAAQRIVGCAQLDPSDIGQARDRAVFRGLDDDLAELFLGGQPALSVHRELEVRPAAVIGERRRAHRAGRHLHVLLPDRAHDIAGRQAARGDLLRIEPHAHGIVAGPEQHDLAHARDAREHVLHVQHRVVAQVDGVVAIVGRHQVHHHRQIGRALDRRHTELAHLFRQARQRLRDPVLHLHLRIVHVGAEPEGHGERQDPVGGGLRGHVEHVLHAVDLLFQRGRDRFRYDLRAGSRVLRAHDHRRRDHLRILADGQTHHRQQAGDEDDDGQHGREARPVDEEFRQIHRAVSSVVLGPAALAVASGAPSMGTRCGVTGSPGRTRWRPFTTMTSPGFNPCLTTRRLSTMGPSVTSRYIALLSAPTTRTNFLLWSVPIARSLIRMPS